MIQTLLMSVVTALNLQRFEGKLNLHHSIALSNLTAGVIASSILALLEI